MTKDKLHIDTSKWVDLYSDDLFSYAYYRVSNRNLAQDFVQETFLSALKAIDRFEEKSSVKTWLFSILKRKIIDYWRQQEARKTNPMSRYSSSEEGDQSWLEDHGAKGSVAEVEDKIEKDEMKQALLNCIDKLSPKWKGIIIDKFIDEKDSEEICNEYEITPSNFWVIVHRAKGELRKCLDVIWSR